MSLRISKPGKHALIVNTPVMNAAGILGFGDSYRDLFDFSAMGAFVTNPITYAPWSPASGTRVIPLPSGILVHTGLPNPGVSKVLSAYRDLWKRLSVPVIAHVVAHSPEDMSMAIRMLEREESVAAIELGLADDISTAEVEWYVRAAVGRGEKPILARLFHGASADHARAAIEAGAGGVVAFAPPRGTARDGRGRLTAGRLYGPMVKPMTLRLVGQLARRLPGVAIIASGGVHSEQDARDYIEAGAAAVQVDAAIWSMPRIVEHIGKDLGGLSLTRPIGMDDEMFALFMNKSSDDPEAES
ncbi:MAG: hypothetical protein L6Q98_19665 [Anaerolineae bacterium]|nr:hypothetical protein [Anaerolineae bacterium]NUQ07229.1 hypothetical protein [Anaerolineae bacterium]